jgi:formate dehydrogenase maturation protein FdhE
VHHSDDVSYNVINAQGHVSASSNNISNAAQSPSNSPAPLAPLAQAAAEHDVNSNSSQDAPFVAPQQQPWWAVWGQAIQEQCQAIQEQFSRLNTCCGSAQSFGIDD